MSAAAFRKGTGILQIYVPMRTGFVQRSTGTANKLIARRMKAMVSELRDAREWEILDAVRGRRLSLRQLFDHYVSNDLATLRDELADTDVTKYLDGWQASVRATLGETGTAATYRRQVVSLTGSKLLASELTPQRISSWLASLDVTPGTRRKNYYALSSFVHYLRASGVIDSNPLELVPVPRKNAARLRWESLEVCRRIVDAEPEPFRALSALIHATGAEVSAALRMTRGDVELDRMLAHVPGSKTASRNRYDVVIEGWARPYLERHVSGLFPSAPLFPGVSRYQAYWYHRQACDAVGVTDYTVHDARHSLAVRWGKRGVSLEAIAEQLGHKGILQVANVYGRFKPTIEERIEEVAR